MKVFDMPRSSGKTTVMLNWLVENDCRILIVPSAHRPHTTKRFAHEYGVPQRVAESRIKSARDLSNMHVMATTEFGIDELDAVLREVIGMPVQIATLTT